MRPPGETSQDRGDSPDVQRRTEAVARRPRGRREVREALLESAQRLIAEQGPANVRLREIAEDAGVNFGLVYQYLGTREELLRAVYQRVAARSATRFEDIDQLADVIDIFMTITDTSISRMMGWAALEGGLSADTFGPSPALGQVVSIIEREAVQLGREIPAEDARVLAAFLEVAALGWRLFRSIGLTAAGVDPTTDADERVTSWLRVLAHAVLVDEATSGPHQPSSDGA